MKGVCIFRNSTTCPVVVCDPFPSNWTGRESPASEMDSMCGGGEVVVAEGGAVRGPAAGWQSRWGDEVGGGGAEAGEEEDAWKRA
jgi:hypothetical protein